MPIERLDFQHYEMQRGTAAPIRHLSMRDFPNWLTVKGLCFNRAPTSYNPSTKTPTDSNLGPRTQWIGQACFPGATRHTANQNKKSTSKKKMTLKSPTNDWSLAEETPEPLQRTTIQAWISVSFSSQKYTPCTIRIPRNCMETINLSQALYLT